MQSTISAAKSLQNVLRSNLGLQCTMKMLVSGAGDMNLTIYGHVLLDNVQIQNPTGLMIDRGV